MEDRLASSLRAARDRTSQNLAARQSVGAPPLESSAPLGTQTGRLLDWPRVSWPFAARRENRSRISIAGTVVLSLVISTGFFILQRVSFTSRQTPAVKAHDRNPELTLARTEEDDQPIAPVERQSSRITTSGNGTRSSAEPFAEETTQKISHFKIDPAGAHKGDDDQFPDEEQTVGAPFQEDRIAQHANRATRPAHQTADDFQDVPPAPADQSIQDDFDHGLPVGHANKVYRLFDDRAGAMPAHMQQQASRNSAFSPALLESKHRRNVKTADWNCPPPSSPSNSSAEAAEVSTSLDDALNARDISGPVIVPGKLSISDAVAIGVHRRMSEGIQQARSEGKAARSIEARSKLLAAQQANGVSGLFPERPETGASDGNPAQPTANPLLALDHTKVMSFQFRNAPWCVVLAEFAAATGLELRMQAFPRGVFNRWDTARYTPSQTLRILSGELVHAGCQLKLVGNALCVLPAAAEERPLSGQDPPKSSTMAASVPSQHGTQAQ